MNRGKMYEGAFYCLILVFVLLILVITDGHGKQVDYLLDTIDQMKISQVETETELYQEIYDLRIELHDSNTKLALLCKEVNDDCINLLDMINKNYSRENLSLMVEELVELYSEEFER